MYQKNGHLKILMIEDNKDDEELIRIALEKRAGYKAVIQRVETEAETIRALEESSWDLVLCDFLLPHFKAKKALKMVKDRDPDLPFILVSGFQDEETALEMLILGANDFIYKENLPRLAIAVRRELMQAGTRMMGRIEIEKNYSDTVRAWGIALELRDIYTKDHTVRVTDLTLILARALEVSSVQFKDIYYGSLLHDIGKMGIPDSILLKNGPLDPGEMSIMRMHPRIAYEMLSGIPFFERALNIPYCHHEKWDGSGYPRGLDGDRIPFEARLFSIADVFDAITHDRPYRQSWSRNKALEHIVAEKGKSFDPEIVDKFVEVNQWQ